MKVIILGDANNPHIIKWVNGLESCNIEVILFSFVGYNASEYSSNTRIVNLNVPVKLKSKTFGAWSKILYLRYSRVLRKLIKKVNPDVLHAHFASSYGLLGALQKFHPFIISVWGDDVCTFPKQSFLHKLIFKYTLRQADHILSTSKYMMKELKLYSHKNVHLTPFGVDTDVFISNINGREKNNKIIIGTIKSLEPQYGIDNLIKAYEVFLNKKPEYETELLIVGGGSLEHNLKALIAEKSLQNKIILTGRINYHEVVKYHNKIDIFVALSNQESFGVAVLEASSCKKPVIVSDRGGLPEVVKEGLTGYIVKPDDLESAASKMFELVHNPGLRHQLGQAGRDFVDSNYNWKNSLQNMFTIYKSLV